nr:phage integrase SAM-like domain-containing protein [Phocaeicola vulgatus]
MPFTIVQTDKIEFEDLTYNFVTDFEKFLYESGYQTNTVAKHRSI